MENKYFKVSKESVWWVIKHIIGMLILYIIYIILMPFGTHEITIARASLISFIGWTVMSSLVLIWVYTFVVELMGQSIRGIITKINPQGSFFGGIPQFTIKIPLTKSMIEELDKKFDRKQIKLPDGGLEKEYDFEFCDRIINKIIDEKLKGCTEKLKISGTLQKGGKQNERKK